jgi:hypothetical protein
MGRIGELDKGKAARSPALSFDRKSHRGDWADDREEFFQLRSGGSIRKVADKKTGTRDARFG